MRLCDIFYSSSEFVIQNIYAFIFSAHQQIVTAVESDETHQNKVQSTSSELQNLTTNENKKGDYCLTIRGLCYMRALVEFKTSHFMYFL